MPDLSFTDRSIADLEVDVIAIPVFEGGELGPGGKELRDALGDLPDVIDQAPLLPNPFKAGLGEAIAVPTLGKISARQVLLIGVGAKGGDPSVARKAGAVLARRTGGAKTVATTLPQVFRGKGTEAFERFWEGFLLSSYEYEGFRTVNTDTKPNRIESVTVVTKSKPDTRGLNRSAKRAQILSDATCLTRDLINLPSSHKGPETLAEEARRIAKAAGLKVKVFDEKELEEKGFGGHIAVGRGSSKPPRLIELRYEPKGATRTIALVGKGITFDSGGLNLKPGNSMLTMKTDMSGAASVLGIMQAIAELKPKGIAIRGYLACAENMPDGNAQRPGDVVTHYGGKTSEIGNTDAEGRLVLADAIVYAKERGADEIIDIATLTGAVVAGLGTHIFAVFSNESKKAKAILKAADTAGEPAWELPLFSGYRAAINSRIADLSNTGDPQVGAGSITAALFLSEFAGDTPWSHLDIAGAARANEDRFEVTRGGTGASVRTIIEYLSSEAR
ncbi:MAG: leucyl aminopeptidase [Actinomycetota bacterium]